MHFSPVLNDMFTISATGYLPLWRAQTKGEVVWLDNFLQQWPSEHESLFVLLARTLQAKVSVSYCLGHQWTLNCLNLHNALRVTTSTREIQVHQVQKFFGWWNWTRSNLCREITITCNCLRQEIFFLSPKKVDCMRAASMPKGFKRFAWAFLPKGLPAILPSWSCPMHQKKQ